ncbi:hypothetical protein MRX96_007560 [Rhipicephalus microplus]
MQRKTLNCGKALGECGARSVEFVLCPSRGLLKKREEGELYRENWRRQTSAANPGGAINLYGTARNVLHSRAEDRYKKDRRCRPMAQLFFFFGCFEALKAALAFGHLLRGPASPRALTLSACLGRDERVSRHGACGYLYAKVNLR